MAAVLIRLRNAPRRAPTPHGMARRGAIWSSIPRSPQGHARPPDTRPPSSWQFASPSVAPVQSTCPRCSAAEACHRPDPARPNRPCRSATPSGSDRAATAPRCTCVPHFTASPCGANETISEGQTRLADRRPTGSRHHPGPRVSMTHRPMLRCRRRIRARKPGLGDDRAAASAWEAPSEPRRMHLLDDAPWERRAAPHLEWPVIPGGAPTGARGLESAINRITGTSLTRTSPSPDHVPRGTLGRSPIPRSTWNIRASLEARGRPDPRRVAVKSMSHRDSGLDLT